MFIVSQKRFILNQSLIKMNGDKFNDKKYPCENYLNMLNYIFIKMKSYFTSTDLILFIRKQNIFE